MPHRNMPESRFAKKLHMESNTPWIIILIYVLFIRALLFRDHDSKTFIVTDMKNSLRIIKTVSGIVDAQSIAISFVIQQRGRAFHLGGFHR